MGHSAPSTCTLGGLGNLAVKTVRNPVLPANSRIKSPEERERFVWLCEQVQTEKDPKKFDQYVRELNDLLEAKHGRIHPEHKTKIN